MHKCHHNECVWIIVLNLLQMLALFILDLPSRSIQCRKVPCPELTCVNSVHDEGHCCPRCPNGMSDWNSLAWKKTQQKFNISYISTSENYFVIFIGSNCWLNEKVINAGDIVLETECKICQCYEGRLSSWIPKNAQPRAVCFVLTNKVGYFLPVRRVSLLINSEGREGYLGISTNLPANRLSSLPSHHTDQIFHYFPGNWAE